MKKILFLLLAITCTSHASDNIKTPENDEPLRVEFSNLNKRVWIENAKEEDLHFLSDVKKEVSKPLYKPVIVSIEAPTVIIVRGVKIEATDSDVFINDTPMKKSLNTVIAKDDSIHIGSFIRDFE